MLLLTVLPTILLALYITFSCAAQDYCGICPDHTMCLHKGMGGKCQTTYRRGVDRAQRTKIVDIHNKLRNKVALGLETAGSNGPQPSASNMKKLGWNYEMATIAQRWADQCDYHHDACRDTNSFWWVGQNIAISTSWPCRTLPTTANWTFPIPSWYGEVKDFDKNIIPRYRPTSQKTGHYTQMVWANTSWIGCGYTAFFSQPGRCSEYFVCNYGTGGNILEQEVYKTGPARESCPKSSKDVNYPGLCGS